MFCPYKSVKEYSLTRALSSDREDGHHWPQYRYFNASNDLRFGTGLAFILTAGYPFP